MEIAAHLTGPTLASQFRRVLERYPDRVAFKEDRGEKTYAEVLDLISRYQAVLSDAGLRRGDGIAALGANRFEVWALGAAVQSLGLYATWLHPMGGVSDQIFQIEDARVSALVVDELHHPERGRELIEFAAGAGLTAWSFGPAEFVGDLEYAGDLETAAAQAGPQSSGKRDGPTIGRSSTTRAAPRVGPRA